MSRATAANCKLPARLYNSLSLGQPATQQIWISSYRDRDGGVLYLWKIWSDMNSMKKWSTKYFLMTTMSHLAFAYSGVSSALPTTTTHHQVSRMIQLLEEWRMFSFYPISKWKHLTMNCKFRTATRFNKELLLVQNWIIQTETIKNNDSTYSYSYFTH